MTLTLSPPLGFVGRDTRPPDQLVNIETSLLVA
jgi:hypothetical protein